MPSDKIQSNFHFPFKSLKPLDTSTCPAVRPPATCESSVPLIGIAVIETEISEKRSSV